MIELLTVLLAILGAWIVGGGAIVGVGLLLQLASGRSCSERPDYFTAFWLGLGATIGLAQVWHLRLPVNAAFALLVVLLGLAGILVLRVWFDVACGVRRHPYAAVAFVIGALWLAVMGLRPLEIYDAGLYHLQVVSWNTNYPVVPGLGNLHGRLAFYSSFFLLLAAFAQGPLATDYYRAVLGLVLLVFMAQVAAAVVRVARARLPRGRAPVSDWLLMFIALPTLITIGGNGVSTTSNDMPLFPLEVLVVYYFVRWTESVEARQLATALMLIGLAATIKLSALGFALACLAVTPFLASGRGLSPISRPLTVGTSIMGVLLVGMLANSVILSGYPFYPSTLFPMPVDWRVPESQALQDRAGIELFAHQPAQLTAVTLQGWDWLPIWIESNWPSLLSPVFGSIVGLVALVGRWPHSATKPGRAALLLIPVCASIAWWFLTAPSYRFVGALLWLAAAIPIADLCARESVRVSRLGVGVFVLLALLPGQLEPLSVVVRAPVAALRHGLTPVPEVAVHTFVTDSGLALLVPENTDQAWASQIPSTPVPDRHLRLRCPNSLACGFAHDARNQA